MLNAQAERLWQEYLTAEKNGLRAVTLKALDRFIEALQGLPRSDWKTWALGLAEEVSDRGSAVPIRSPLFRRVVLPALVEGVLAGERGCARWLASFERDLLKCRETGLPAELETAPRLLREALRTDPADDLARRRLVDRNASYLNYTLHELPLGVLYGYDGATVEQCGELLDFLAEFREHVVRTGQEERFRALIDQCDYHFHAYANYLRQDNREGGYKAYLSSLGHGQAVPD